MVEIERLQHFPVRYGQYFADVIEYYQDKGRCDFEWGYGKADRYKVSFSCDGGALSLTLASIRYDGDWQPIYTPVYSIVETEDKEQHYLPEFGRDQVPHDAVAAPELVLRGLLHMTQDALRLRKRNRVE